MSINSACKNVMKITEEEFNEMEMVAIAQTEYLHPLKLETQARQHRLGEYNLEAIRLLRELQRHIKTGGDKT